MGRAENFRSRAFSGLAVVAFLFGLLSVKAGAGVLFAGGAQREAAGHYVPFVVWFNFLAGFAYMAAAPGVFLRKAWGAWLGTGIAASTLLVFFAFGIHAVSGGAYEPRTVGAMSLRSALWIVIAAAAWRDIAGRRASGRASNPL